jgi:hypothetical protein
MQHWIHKTQDEDKQNKKQNTENWKDDQYGPHRNPRENTDAHKKQAVPSFNTPSMLLI